MQQNDFHKNISVDSKSAGTDLQRLKDESGIALVLVMIALALVTLFSAYLALTGVEELRTSDISESAVQARFAARAGIEHAREVLRGLTFNNLLRGTDGTYTNTADYLNAARLTRFRNLAPWSVFRSMDLANPSSSVSNLSDDGLINDGLGTVLIPQTGNFFSVTNPYGNGTLTTARYFLKVTDNNGDASEIARDAANNPFIDGDGMIIIRSIGVAQSIAEGSGGSARRNSVVVYESRLQQGNPFVDLGSPMLMIGNNINVNFAGNAYLINNSGSGYGIATIDTNPSDAYSPAALISAATLNNQGLVKGQIQGNCPSSPDHCIADITADVASDPMKQNLSDPEWLYDFVYNQVPSMADYVLADGARLTAGNIGTVENPKITLVNGNCSGDGDLHGAGILVVKGDLEFGGAIRWDGLVLVIGAGNFRATGMNDGIHGGLVVAGVAMGADGHAYFTESQTRINDLDIRGNSRISTYDGLMANSGSGLIPLRQVAFREIVGGMDP
jgi:hypothetical protein